ncbi:hypothetical protein ACFTXM_02635 [Streptomyces sp. NPDC056930]
MARSPSSEPVSGGRQSSSLAAHTPVIEAFDAILDTPTSTVADDLEIT